jgi:hypothetical protein
MKFGPGLRKHKLLSFGLCFGAVAALSMTPLMDAVSRAGVKAGEDMMALLDGRSPGERAEGALLHTKALKAPAQKLAGNPPRQYAAPKTRERQPFAGAPPVESALPSAVPLFPSDGSAVPLGRIASAQGPGTYYGPPGGGGVPPRGGSVLPPGEGGILPPDDGIPPVDGVPPVDGIPPVVDLPPGGDIPPDIGRPTPPGNGGEVPRPPAAVPEPAAWMSMIVGFGAIGTMLRRRRKLTTSGVRTQSA